MSRTVSPEYPVGRCSRCGAARTCRARGVCAARRWIKRGRAELRFVHHMGVRHLVHEPWRRGRPWWRALPIQARRVVELRALACQRRPAATAPITADAVGTAGEPEPLRAGLDAVGITYAQSAHTLYLSPTALTHPALAGLAASLPTDAGLKVARHPGGVAGTYVDATRRHAGVDAWAESGLQRALTYRHGHLALVANALYSEGIGPRLYDLLDLEYAGARFAAYAVEHVDGRLPTDAEWAAGVAAIRSLEAGGVLRASSPRGYRSRDFARPHGHGNAWSDRATGAFRYVDFQNFHLVDYARRLATAHAACSDVAWSTLAGHRAPSAEAAVAGALAAAQWVGDLTERAGIRLDGTHVRALGPEAAPAGAACLAHGAAWLSVRADRARHAALGSFLLALGVTRLGFESPDGAPASALGESPRGAPGTAALLIATAPEQLAATSDAWTAALVLRVARHTDRAVSARLGARVAAESALPAAAGQLGGGRCVALRRGGH